jgi:hypothetical protein
MFTFTDYVERSLPGLFPHDELAARFPSQPTDRTAALLEAILACYRERGGASTGPTIAIVDWPGGLTRHEQAASAARFTELGCPPFVCAPHELVCDGRTLSAGGRRIDVVQRRVLFPDFLTRADELAPLVRAYRDGLVCVVNPLRSYLAGNKALLAMLNGSDFRKRAPAADLAVLDGILPDTSFVGAADRERLIAERDRWVLKSAFGYGGKEVVIGDQVDHAAWSSAIEGTDGRVWIAQRRVTIPRYRLPIRTDAGVGLEPFYLNWSPWLFGGRAVAGTTRTSASPLVSLTQRGALLPTIASAD